MKIFDTNYLLRLILRDNAEMAIIAAETITAEKVFIPDEVIAEAVYVLTKSFSLDRHITVQGISKVIHLSNAVTSNLTKLEKALYYFSSTSLDFVDCLMCAYRVVEGYEVCTFDKKLNRLIKREDENRSTVG